MAHAARTFPRRVVDGFCVVDVDGEIDLAVARLLTAELEKAVAECSPRVLIDLTNLTFIDSTGLASLVAAHRCATAAGGGVRLVGPNARIAKVLAITQLDHVLPVHDTVETACAAADPASLVNPERPTAPSSPT